MWRNSFTSIVLQKNVETKINCFNFNVSKTENEVPVPNNWIFLLFQVLINLFSKKNMHYNVVQSFFKKKKWFLKTFL